MLSDHAFSVLVPVLDQILGWRIGQIRTLFESNGLMLQAWEKARTDRVTVRESASGSSLSAEVAERYARAHRTEPRARRDRRQVVRREHLQLR